MKHVDFQRRVYWSRVLAKRERRARKKRRQRGRQSSIWSGAVRIQAPREFRLDAKWPRTKLLTFIRKLRSDVGLERKKVVLDFSATSNMWADGTLLFKAEICRLLRVTNWDVPIRCLPPRNQKVAQVLKQVGIFNLLRHTSNVRPIYGDVVNWRYANGHEVDGARYDEILGSYDGEISGALAEGLYLGLTEAMTNCHHHAYIGPRQDGLNQTDEPREWWMFSQERDGLLSVVFCDLGVGIPETLPKTRPALWRKILTLGRVNDGDAIEAAIRDSRTRTGKSYRGKGLKQLVDAISLVNSGHLRIMSNKGAYFFSRGHGYSTTFDGSILGTLIQWTAPI